jgi:hypothetical protein
MALNPNSDALRAPVWVEPQKLLAPRHRLGLVFAEPELRPPIYEELVADMQHIIFKVASTYVDATCVELHFEDLVADCWAKTSAMVHRGLLTRCRNRIEYFKQYKTAILNHVRSLVQRHRFTEKRTGIRPPPKEERHTVASVSTKPHEVRIDDPDCGFQLADLAESGSASEGAHYRELLEDVNSRLDHDGRSVLGQLLSPNGEALFVAWYEAHRGLAPGQPLRVKIRQEHLAKGVNMDLDKFQGIRDQIKRKCSFMKDHQEDDPRQLAAMATLVQFFGVQIPRSISETVRKRALTVAAQHQYDRIKDDEGIKEALRICGIPLPVVRNDRFECFGVMFLKENHTCENCGVREACEMQAANFGLNLVTMSAKLLGTRHPRTAVVKPARYPGDPAGVESEREEEIMVFLDENFRRVNHRGEICYQHKDRLEGPGMQLIFSIGREIAPLRLRFIGPAEELKSSLVLESSSRGGKPSWYLPPQLSVEQSLNLIRAHAQDTFTRTAPTK